MTTKYTAAEFTQLYGSCDLLWSDITSVQCTERDEYIDVVTYYGDIVASTFSIIFHEGQWKKHGEFDWTQDSVHHLSYFRYGKLHREDGPAITSYIWGNLFYSRWYKNGIQHREDEPAFEKWHDDGKLEEQIWYINGLKHREDGPAYLYWYSSGTLNVSRWHHNGKCHREDAPACSIYTPDGKLVSTEWYYNGKMYEPVLTKRAL